MTKDREAGEVARNRYRSLSTSSSMPLEANTHCTLQDPTQDSSAAAEYISHGQWLKGRLCMSSVLQLPHQSGSAPTPCPLCNAFSHLNSLWGSTPSRQGASYPAFLMAGSLTRFPAVQRDGLCLPIFQMFKSGVLSRSLQRPTRSSEHAGRDRDTCSGEQKGAQWQGPKGSSSSDLWGMNEALHFPLRLGSKEKRPSHTLRGPKPRNAECMTKRQTITWDPCSSVHVKGKEKCRDQQVPLLASGRGKMPTPLSLTTFAGLGWVNQMTSSKTWMKGLQESACYNKTKQQPKKALLKKILNLKLSGYPAPTVVLVAHQSQGNGITHNSSAFAKIS